MTDEPAPVTARRASVALRHPDGRLEHAILDALYIDVVHSLQRRLIDGQPVRLPTTCGRTVQIGRGTHYCITELKPEPWPW